MGSEASHMHALSASHGVCVLCCVAHLRWHELSYGLKTHMTSSALHWVGVSWPQVFLHCAMTGLYMQPACVEQQASVRQADSQRVEHVLVLAANSHVESAVQVPCEV
jgi:hypothetical protein